MKVIHVKGHYKTVNGKRIWIKPHIRITGKLPKKMTPIKTSSFNESINGHIIKIVDLRPIGKKDEKMCIKCGKRGLRELKKSKCTAKSNNY